jgi:hypothetical protein
MLSVSLRPETPLIFLAVGKLRFSSMLCHTSFAIAPDGLARSGTRTSSSTASSRASPHAFRVTGLVYLAWYSVCSVLIHMSHTILPDAHPGRSRARRDQAGPKKRGEPCVHRKPCAAFLRGHIADIRDVAMHTGLDTQEQKVVACACGKGFFPTLALSLSRCPSLVYLKQWSSLTLSLLSLSFLKSVGSMLIRTYFSSIISKPPSK